MNGPDHYREAERLLLDCQLTPAENGDPAVYPRETERDSVANPLAAAQVHATLALAAATAMRTGSDYYDASDDVEAWAEVIDAAVLRDGVGPTMPGHPCTNPACCAVDGYQLAGNPHDHNGGAV